VNRYGGDARRRPAKGLWRAPDGQIRAPIALIAAPTATARMKLTLAVAGLALTVVNAADAAEIAAAVASVRPHVALVGGFPTDADGACPALEAIRGTSADLPVLRLTPATEWEHAENLRRRRGMELVSHPDDLAQALVFALQRAGWQRG
jgi:hypothetical protein